MRLSVKNASFLYDKTSDEMLLNDISFDAETGDIVAVLGANGVGKTTLLRCILNFLKWNSGGCFLDGKDTANLSEAGLRKSMAYVPQAHMATVNCSVKEMVLLGCAGRHTVFESPTLEDERYTDEILSMLSIEGIAGSSCNELSGGQLQLVYIARALAEKPKVLILDEPETNLDFRNQLLILDTLTKLAAGGMTVIFNTHYPEHAMQYANRTLLLMRHGEYVFGATKQTVTELNLRKAFGVNAYIHEFDMPDKTYTNITPVSIDTKEYSDFEISQKGKVNRISVISIIAGDLTQAEHINHNLHLYKKYITGRMGQTLRGGKMHIINVTMDISEEKLSRLYDDLKILPGVSIKITCASEE